MSPVWTIAASALGGVLGALVVIGAVTVVGWARDRREVRRWY